MTKKVCRLPNWVLSDSWTKLLETENLEWGRIHIRHIFLHTPIQYIFVFWLAFRLLSQWLCQLKQVLSVSSWAPREIITLWRQTACLFFSWHIVGFLLADCLESSNEHQGVGWQKASSTHIQQLGWEQRAWCFQFFISEAGICDWRTSTAGVTQDVGYSGCAQSSRLGHTKFCSLVCLDVGKIIF